MARAFQKVALQNFFLLVFITLSFTGCQQEPDWTLATKPAPDLNGRWVAYPNLFSLDVEADDKGYTVKGGALVSLNKSHHDVNFAGRMSASGRIISVLGEIEEPSAQTKGLSLVMLGTYKNYSTPEAFLEGENLVDDPRMKLEIPVRVLVMRCGLAKREDFLDPEWKTRWSSIKHGTNQHLILE